MATSHEVEAALTRLRTARSKLFEASTLRTAAIERRTRVNVTITELNQRITDARTELAAARLAVQAVLAQPETEPEA